MRTSHKKHFIRTKASRKGAAFAEQRLIGLIGAGPAVGVTHTAVTMAGYLTGICRRRCAVLERNDHGVFDRLEESWLGKKNSGCRGSFRILDVDYYRNAGTETLVLCKKLRYQEVIVDYGAAAGGNQEEFFRCDRQFLLAGLSEWQTGAYFRQRNLIDERGKKLADRVAAQGLRNGYLLAAAPTSSTSIIAGTTAGLDPVMNRYFMEEKKNGLMPRVAPELSMETFWYYKNAHLIDQSWSVRACGIRQRHIDQAQSMNLYITNEYTFRGVLNLYLQAWEEGVKTIYYIRSRSLEVEECEVCSS